jgi:hypothetical protein
MAYTDREKAMTKTQEPLAVLEMPEMQQAVTLYNLGVNVIAATVDQVYYNWGRDTNNEIILLSLSDPHRDRWGGAYIDERKLADLAFRLTKEVDDWPALAKALERVRMYWCEHTWEKRKAASERQKYIPSNKFWNYVVGPMAKIIAALIAEEMK